MTFKQCHLVGMTDFITSKGETPARIAIDLYNQFLSLGGSPLDLGMWFKDIPTNSAQSAYLTNGGNLLRQCDMGWYFCKPNGEFIRQVVDSEAEYLKEVCLQISLQQEVPHPEFFPVWHFIKSVLVTQDNSNYKAEMSCNGGCYSFQTYHDWYVARYPNGKYGFCFVERQTTSADFSYTELGGNFDSNPGTCYLQNVQEEVSYTMGCASHDEVLEKIGQMSSLEHLWNEMLQIIPSKWEDDEEGCIKPAISFSDKKEIALRLKSIFQSQDSLEEYTWEDLRKKYATARRKKRRVTGRNTRR